MKERRSRSSHRLTRSSSIFLYAVVALLALAFITSSTTPVASQGKVVYTLDYNQTISTASSEYLREGLDKAASSGAECVVLMLNTFGGALQSTEDMIAMMESSSVPVVVYVYPGAKAWSAGAFLLMGSDVAAMAPGSVVGSSQPVSYSPLGGSTPVTDDKIVNALATRIAELANLHGRNGSVAERFVKQNLNLGAEEAKASNVTELLASDLASLLQQLDGMNVTYHNRQWSKVLSTAHAEVVSLSPSIPVAFLKVLSDPTVSSLLFIIGLYALIYGIMTPGYGGEIIGGVLIILSLVGMGFDFNFVALILIVIGIGLLIAEFQTPGMGVLGAGGVICIVLGTLFLFPREAPKWLINTEWFQVFAVLTLTTAAIMGSLLGLVAYKAFKTRKMKGKMFKLEGETATVTEDIPPGETGYVTCFGELWLATSDYHLKKGDKVIIIKKEGERIVVEPMPKAKKRSP